MHIEEYKNAMKNPPDLATGDVWTEALSEHPYYFGEDVIVALMYYTPESRTVWHTHENTQYLVVLDGPVRVGRRGLSTVELDSGDAIVIDGNVEHWYGAVENSGARHMVVLEKADDPLCTTDWHQHVTDEEYAMP